MWRDLCEPSCSEQEWLEMAAVLRELGTKAGEFDANEATFAIGDDRLMRGYEVHRPIDILLVLRDLQDLGYTRHKGRRSEYGPQLSEWVAADD